MRGEDIRAAPDPADAKDPDTAAAQAPADHDVAGPAVPHGRAPPALVLGCDGHERKRTMNSPQIKTLNAQTKAIGNRQVESIASTETLDREHDRILASGWDLTAFRRNPVCLWAHD